MLRLIKWITMAAFFSLSSVSVFGQAAVQTFIDGFSYRELNAGVDGSPNPIAAQPNRYLYHYHSEVGYDQSQILEGAYRGSNLPLTSGGNVSEFMNWRVIYPNGYDPSGNTKYPMIIMLHGAGEGGRLWSGAFDFKPTDVDYDNNGKNIVWGGQPHLDAVNTPPPNPRAFPGIVIWPQCSVNGAWDSGWDNGTQNQVSIMVTRILEHFIAVKGADPDRIYMHGLSNGAVGTWDLAAKRPDLFAAILPMSGTPRDLNAQTDILVTTPIWLSQGGLDTNPQPQAAVTCVATLQAKGQNPRYSYYPNVGHDTWNYTYADPEFFSWMLSKTKRDIYVFGGDPNICGGGSLRMGFSAGMNSYQWYNGSTAIPGATTRYYTTSVTGTFTVKYVRRVDGVLVTSNPLVVGTKGTSTLTPAITSAGSLYETVNQPGVTNPITFTAPLGYGSYSWFKNGTAISGATGLTSNIYKLTLGGTGAAGDAGVYTAKVLEGTGCQSLASNPLTVVYFSSQTGYAPPVAPTFVSNSPTSVKVNWPDYSGETSYELWRYRFSGSSPAYAFEAWGLIASLPANTITYTDNTTRPQGTYRYAIRAILPDGHGSFSAESGNYGAPTDAISPTPPTSLFATNVKDTQVTLTWSPSYDNDYVYKYEVYNGATLVTTLTGGTEALTAPLTTTVVTGLNPGTAYVLSVRAIDYKGNPSAFADPVSITTLSALPGLIFKYYTFTGNIPGTDGAYMPEPMVSGSFDFSQIPAQTGSVATFDISGANVFQNTGDPNTFVYSFDGFIDIPTAGNYRFQTGSDDGSRLYINGVLLVNNDHLQGTTYRDNNSPNANDLTLPAGKIPIRVTYFEQGGGNVLDVQWEKTDAPTFGWVTIPASVLYQSGVTIKNYYLATGATDPSLLASWTTNADGSAGTAPADFTTALQIFTLKNASTVTISNPWTVSGNGSKVIAGDGTNAITVNVSGAFVGSMDAKAGATINLTNPTVPVFGTLDATSTVNFNVSGSGTLNIPNATFGNVNFMTPNTYVFPLNATTVLGDLVVADGAKTQGTTTNVSALRIGGDLTFNNTAQNPLPSGNQAYALSFVGGTSHVVSFNTGINPTFFSIQADVNDDVSFVNSGTPTYTVGSTLGGGIVLKSGSTLNLGAGNLVLSGAGTINPNFETGSLIMSGGNVTFSSTATQNSTVNFDPTGNTLLNLTVTAPSTTTVSLGSTANVKGTVTLNAGLLNGGTSGFLTLVSDSLTNARIATIPAGARINGSITAERFMVKKNAKVYRYISSPVKYATAAMLQDAFPITGDFTGANTIPGVPHSAASMLWYNEPNYIQFPANGGTSADTMKVGLGYTAFMRKTSGGIKWSVQGPPNQGTIDYSPFLKPGTGSSDGWNLIGNPYASSIAWTGSSTGGWTVTNINPTVSVRDNTDATHYIWRVYRTGITAPEYAGKALLTGGVIAAGQAFWVQAGAGTTPVLKVSEAAKSATNVQIYRTEEGAVVPSYDVLTVTLSDGTSQDFAFIAHDPNAVEAYEGLNDAVKQQNSGFNLSTLSSDNINLVINMTPQVYCEKNIKLNITNAVAGNYSLLFDGPNNFKTATNAILKDNFLNKTFVITSGAKYDFAITADAASTGSARFAILENPIVDTSLALKTAAACETNPSILIGSSQKGVLYQAFANGIAVSDSIRSTGDTLKLVVNRKLLGFGSHNVNVTAAINACAAIAMDQNVMIDVDTLQLPVITYKSGQLIATPKTADHYQWYQDGKALKGKTDAKLLVTEGSGYQVEVTTGACTKMSQVFVLTGFEGNVSGLTAYPNPFLDKITVTLPEPATGGTAVLYSILGQPVQSSSFSGSGTQQVELKFPNLEPGAYILGIGSHRIKVVKVN